MDLALVNCFLRVAELGSINRAAADLEMTQPALARRIAALERDLRVQLLVRDARGVRLTDAGLMLANGVRPILRQAELLRGEIGRQVKTQVAIGLPFSMNRLITAPFASSHLRHDSPISLRVYEGFIHHLREWVHQSLIDVAILDDREDELSQLERIPLIREQLFVVGNHESDLNFERPVGAGELGSCKLILPGRPNLIRLKVETYLKQHGEKFRRAADAETLPLCLSLVKDGHGYTIMPYCALYEFPEVNTLKAAPVGDLSITWAMYISKARRHQTGVRQTAQRLQNAMTQLVYDGKWSLAQVIRESAAPESGK